MKKFCSYIKVKTFFLTIKEFLISGRLFFSKNEVICACHKKLGNMSQMFGKYLLGENKPLLFASQVASSLGIPALQKRFQ
jgi:hypothetical protein